MQVSQEKGKAKIFDNEYLDKLRFNLFYSNLDILHIITSY